MPSHIEKLWTALIYKKDPAHPFQSIFGELEADRIIAHMEFLSKCAHRYVCVCTYIKSSSYRRKKQCGMQSSH